MHHEPQESGSKGLGSRRSLTYFFLEVHKGKKIILILTILRHFDFFKILILTSVQWSIPEVSGSPPSDNAIVLTSTEIHACISKCFSILTSNVVTHTTYSEDPEQSLGGQIFKRSKRESFEI